MEEKREEVTSAEEAKTGETTELAVTTEEVQSERKEVTVEEKEIRELKSYENIKPTLWERLTMKQKVLTVTITVAVIVLAIVIAVVVIRTNHYKSLTQGQAVYVQDGTFKGVKAFKDAEYSSAIGAYLPADKDEADAKDPAVTMTDGKYIYYAEEKGNGSFSLFYSKLNGKNKTLLKANVTDYAILKEGVVLYAADNTLYRHEIKDEKITNISSDVTLFRLNRKKTAVLTVGNGVLATMKLDDASTRKELDIAASYFIAADDKFETVVYDKSGVLYVKHKEELPYAIASGVSDVSVHNIDGKFEIYYRENGNTLKCYKKGAKSSEMLTDKLSEVYGAEQEKGVFLYTTSDGSLYMVDHAESTALTGIVSVESRLICDEDGAITFVGYDTTGKGTLYKATARLLKKGGPEVIATDVISLEFIDGKNLCVVKENGTGETELYYNDERVALAVIPGSVQRTADGSAFVYACRTYGVGDDLLAIYDGEKETVIGSVVLPNVIAVSPKDVYYMSCENGTCHFMKYNGKKSKTLAENVTEVGYIFY